MELPLELLNRYQSRLRLQFEDVDKKIATIESGSALHLDGSLHFERRRKMIAAVAAENFDDAFERYNGENNLLPINYLQIGYLKSRSVGRIQFFDLELRKTVVATGFLISPELVLTNHHVFPTLSSFRDAQIEFEFEYDLNGREKTRIIFDLDGSVFFHSNKELDFALINIHAKDRSGTRDVTERGYLVLNGQLGKAGLGDYASIIQHAEGRPMQIALRENRIIDNLLPDLLTYNSDTAQGSSGSPVFNDEWQVIALHSAGVALKNAQGKFVDKDGQVIPELNGRIDSSKLVWISNQGIRVSAIMKSLATMQQPHPFILHLFTAGYSDEKQLSFLSLPDIGIQDDSKLKKASAETPPSAIHGFPNVYININYGEKTFSVNADAPRAPLQKSPAELEKKLEDEIDFNNCKGFDEFFLSVHTPLPSLLVKLKKQVAFYVDNPNLFILKYHHYSSIHHALRKMPVMSAINISSAGRYRLARTDDNWFRDRRIDLDLQLTDEFYRKSGFDKGHMSRREDAEWGETMVFAETAANMTCSYANACPQVPDFNRAVFGYKGKWGGLEIELLEKAVLKEPDGAKICVYNGPVFSDDDPVFKGIQVPMKFWKIVVWRNAAAKLKATGFLLSQEQLVDQIPFEALLIDQIFKTSQCSIRQIERLTKLSFTKVRTWDSFVPLVAGQEETALNAETFEKFIIDNKDDADEVQVFS